jgi:hypothetical protein
MPSLIQMMDAEKPQTVGQREASSLGDEIAADALAGEGGQFLAPELNVHDTLVRVNPGQSGGGRYGLYSFENWEINGTRIQRHTQAQSVLRGDFWLFDMGAEPSAMLEEAEQAMGIARQMIEHLCPGKKADYLLLIGQASQTRFFERRLTETLRDCYSELTLGGTKTKLCVALGACHIYDLQNGPKDDRPLDIVPTLLKRIVGVTRVKLKRVLTTVLRSRKERNAVLTLRTNGDGAWELLRRPSAVSFYVDASYSQDVQTLLASPLCQQLTPRKSGFETTDGSVCALVADPDDEASFNAPEALPEAVRRAVLALRAELPELNACWCFCFWPEGAPGAAWLFSYQP